MNATRPGALYADHLATLQQRATAALERGGFDHLVVPSGTLHYQLFDDRDYPYAVNPQFKAWLPLTGAPGSWLVATPGVKPKLVFLQPRDYWHVVPAAPSGYWVEHFDIVVIREPDEAKRREILEQVHARAYEVLPYINAGQYRVLTAHRANIEGLRPTIIPVFWGVTKR